MNNATEANEADPLEKLAQLCDTFENGYGQTLVNDEILVLARSSPQARLKALELLADIIERCETQYNEKFLTPAHWETALNTSITLMSEIPDSDKVSWEKTLHSIGFFANTEQAGRVPGFRAERAAHWRDEVIKPGRPGISSQLDDIIRRYSPNPN